MLGAVPSGWVGDHSGMARVGQTRRDLDDRIELAGRLGRCVESFHGV